MVGLVVADLSSNFLYTTATIQYSFFIRTIDVSKSKSN